MRLRLDDANLGELLRQLGTRLGPKVAERNGVSIPTAVPKAVLAKGPELAPKLGVPARLALPELGVPARLATPELSPRLGAPVRPALPELGVPARLAMPELSPRLGAPVRPAMSELGVPARLTMPELAPKLGAPARPVLPSSGDPANAAAPKLDLLREALGALDRAAPPELAEPYAAGSRQLSSGRREVDADGKESPRQEPQRVTEQFWRTEVRANAELRANTELQARREVVAAVEEGSGPELALNAQIPARAEALAPPGLQLQAAVYAGSFAAAGATRGTAGATAPEPERKAGAKRSTGRDFDSVQEVRGRKRDYLIAATLLAVLVVFALAGACSAF